MKCLCLPDGPPARPPSWTTSASSATGPTCAGATGSTSRSCRRVRQAGGEVRWADVTVHHSGYQDPALRGRKLERDLHLLHLEDADQPRRPVHPVQPRLRLPRTGQAGRGAAAAAPQPGEVAPQGLHRPQTVRSDRRVSPPAGPDGRGAGGRPRGPRRLPRRRGASVPGGSCLRRERGDLAGAEACLLRVLNSKPGPHFASVDAGLRGYKTRHNLAVVYHQLGRAGDAKGQSAACRRRAARLPARLAGPGRDGPETGGRAAS